jgi:surface carbohydrate biosynthesis protein
VETKSREFHGKLLLALHLLEKGHPVLFGEQGRLWDYVDLLEPSIYLDKSVAATRVDWFTRCQNMGHLVVSWDEEGLVFFDNWLYRKQRIEPAAFDQVERFFAWGEAQREAICEEYPQYRDKIALCGNPRFDLLRCGLRSFYQPAVNDLRRRFGPVLLINTNFAFHNHYKSPTEVRQILAKYPINDEPGYMDKWISMHREMHEAYLAMVPELLARFPDHSVVIRPHPSESHAPWQELARNHSRLHVDSTGNVHEWILASEAVVHFNCTTAVEAFLLDVPAIAYRPKRYPRYENYLPNALSENAFSLAELMIALDGRNTARERGVLWTEEQWQTAMRYMSGLDGQTAAQRIANEVSELSSRGSHRRRGARFRLMAEIKRIYRRGLRIVREARSSPDGYAAQKFPGISKSEVDIVLREMMAVSGQSLGYSVHTFAKNIYWLIPTHES